MNPLQQLEQYLWEYKKYYLEEFNKNPLLEIPKEENIDFSISLIKSIFLELFKLKIFNLNLPIFKPNFSITPTGEIEIKFWNNSFSLLITVDPEKEITFSMIYLGRPFINNWFYRVSKENSNFIEFQLSWDYFDPVFLTSYLIKFYSIKN